MVVYYVFVLTVMIFSMILHGQATNVEKATVTKGLQNGVSAQGKQFCAALPSADS
jgi:hypothetical protein